MAGPSKRITSVESPVRPNTNGAAARPATQATSTTRWRGREIGPPPRGRPLSVAARRTTAPAAVAAVVALSGIGVAPSEARSAPPRPMAQCSLPNVATGTRTCSYTFVHNDTIETFVVPPTAKGPIQITTVGAPGFGEDATRSHGA